MSNDDFFSDHPQLFVQQRKEWTEIMIDWETRNQYAVMDANKADVSSVVEKSGGFKDFMARTFLRSHRPFEIAVLDAGGSVLFSLMRTFFFLFSTLEIQDTQGLPVGRVERRFGVLYRKYDLHDHEGILFAKIKGPVWRIWTFPVESIWGSGAATITKKWGGGLREIFTDADIFMVDFSKGQWSEAQRRVIFAAAISIDFDFFENNQGNRGLIE